MDHIFTLNKSRIDIFLHKKKKVFSAFIDFKKPFDTVWRLGLWIKLISFGITGKLFNVIRNIYNNIKSCIQVNGQKSDCCFGPASQTMGSRWVDNGSVSCFQEWGSLFTQHLK